MRQFLTFRIFWGINWTMSIFMLSLEDVGSDCFCYLKSSASSAGFNHFTVHVSSTVFHISLEKHNLQQPTGVLATCA